MLWDFLLVVLKVGAFGFGGGYAMITPLHYDLVTRYAWLTESEFGSAVAAGQISPGPLMIMVAFMGYKVAGLAGAALGTLGLFLPSAVIVVALSGSFLRFKDAPAIKGLTQGVSLAVVGLLGAVVIDLARGALQAPLEMGVAVAAFVAAGPLKRDPIVVLLGSGLAGLVAHALASS
jgi:chromate transporter